MHEYSCTYKTPTALFGLPLVNYEATLLYIGVSPEILLKEKLKIGETPLGNVIKLGRDSSRGAKFW